MLLVWRFIIGVARREHHALHAEFHHFVKESAHAVRVGAIKQRRVRGYPETALNLFTDAFHPQVIPTVAADRKIVVFALAIHVDRKRQVLARLEEIELLFEQQRVRAQVYVLLPRHQPFHNLVDLRMHQRLAARYGHHWCPAFVDRLEALFRRQFLLQDVWRILDFAATRASQIAAKQRLQHQYKGISLAPSQLLLQQIGGDGPPLRNRYRHRALLSSVRELRPVPPHNSIVTDMDTSAPALFVGFKT